MVLKVSNITENSYYINNQQQILNESFWKYRKSPDEIFTETLEWFRKDKPELTEKELKEITEKFLSQIEILLK